MRKNQSITHDTHKYYAKYRADHTATPANNTHSTQDNDRNHI